MKRFAPPCFRCMQPILDDHTSAFGRDWHQRCFVCYVSTLDRSHCVAVILSLWQYISHNTQHHRQTDGSMMPHCGIVAVHFMNVTYMAQIRKMQKMCHVDCCKRCSLCHQKCFQPCTKYRHDMSSRSAAGKLFHAVGPLTAKLRSP